MAVQYTSYGSIPAVVQSVVANKVKLLDQYILFQTGEYEYTALIRNTSTGDVQQLVFTRESGYNSYYSVAISNGTWDWSISNEYYCYSNCGYGSALELPVVSGTIAHASVILCVSLMFAILYKGVLFPCLKRYRKGF